jgi:cholesterol oxidase
MLARTPIGEACPMVLDLDVLIDDVERFVNDPAHLAVVRGTARCAALGGELSIREGTCNLLTETSDTELRMTYTLRLAGPGGQLLDLSGVKTLRRDARIDLWADATTLLTEVRVPGSDEVVAAGVLRITLGGFLRQLTTFRPTAGPNAVKKLGALGGFGAFFVSELGRIYRRRPAGTAPLPAWLRKVAR